MVDTGRHTARLSPARQALLTRRIRQRPGPDEATVPRRPDGAPRLLSFAQERLWFMEQFAPGTAAYVIPVARRLRGGLDVGALRRAFDALIARHETLRTRYPVTADGRPALVVDDTATVDLTVVEAPSLAAASDLVNAACGEPFDVATGPLLRALLVRLTPDDHVLLVLTHHSISDGWSTEILLSELFTLYGTGIAGVPSPLPPLPVQYGDFAAWQRERLSGERLRTAVGYWRDQLDGVEPLALPTDRPRPARQTFNGAGYGFFVERDLLDRLTALGREHGGTLYMVLLAAFQLLLARHSGQRDFAVGSPIAGRPHRELEGLIGMFVSMLALRAQLDGDPTFVELLARTRETSLDAYVHQEVPFAQLVTELGVTRDVRRPPVFQAVLTAQNYGTGGAPQEPGPLAVEPFPVQARGTRFDLELSLMEWPDGLHGAFNYSRDLFDEATIARLGRHLDRLLRAVADRPAARVSELDILDPDERHRVLSAWNATDTAFPDRATLHGLVAAQAAATPDAIAVAFGAQTLTYAQLEARANRVAHRLAAAGVGPGGLVAVCAERSLELVVGLLGVLKSGAAYTPLDPEYPAERLAFMMADAGAAVLLTQRHLDPPGGAAQVLPLDDLQTWAGQPETPLPPRASADDVAYMIYTSGSTGRPKGVPNTHRGIVNRLDWMQRTFALGADDVVLQKTPASFDVSVWELFWPLLAGARLVLAAPGGHKDAAYLRDLIRSAGVTTVHFVPSMLALFLAEEGVEACRSLRRVVCSGEELPAAPANELLRRLPHCELWNLYGPTEAAVDVSAWRCTGGAETVPIGSPVQNIRLYVLDGALQPVPIGVPGQLYIGGVGLALGYHRRPALTADRFVPDPYGPPGGRLYATGDLARWRPDGAIEFLGRLDNQVKLRGLRIELGEIESALHAVPGVAEAAVVVREDTPGDKRLVAYLAGADVPDGTALRAELKRTLPDYLVPAAFVALERLPLTPSGKLDRRALPVPPQRRDLDTEAVPPCTPAEVALAAIWCDVLGVPAVGIDDDFFALGGHSLLATQVVARARRELVAAGGQPVSVMDLFTHPTVRELAAVAELPSDRRGPKPLLYRLSKPVSAPTRSLVCVPYGGGSAVVYQPLAEALPAGHELWSVAIPGHDVGVAETRLPFAELARRCADEIRARVEGPIALYGHCGVGGALIVEIARLLEDAGRDLVAVYVGAIFPFARPRGRVLHGLSRLARLEPLRSNRTYVNWLTAMGADVAGLDGPAQQTIIGNLRRDSAAAEEYFTARLHEGGTRLRAPIIAVMGERDPAGDFYQERFREWHFLADTVALVMLDEAGHFFLKYRAADLAEVVTRTDEAIAGGRADTLPRRDHDRGWWLQGTSTATAPPATTGPRPGLGRFLLVALGQLVSIMGSALTEFAIPIWIYQQTGSLFRFALFAVLALVPGLLVTPLAGAIVDRVDRRRVMLAGDLAAGLTQAALLGLLVTGGLHAWHIYALLVSLSLALTFQRLAYASAVPQLVPKQYLGHANGIVQMTGGVALFVVPLVAVGLLAVIGLRGILVLDVASYAFAVTVVLLVRFPKTLPWRRRESLGAEIRHGFTYSWQHRGFRSMLLFFAMLNIFLSPLFLLLTPLVLAFDTLDAVARVAMAGGAGATIGGLALGLWGGPKRRRMRGTLALTAVLAACCALTGLRADLWLIAAGAFAMALALALLNGVYATIVQVKVPQRFHGRVFALNTLIAWSTLPIGHGLVAPLGARLFEPLMRSDGLLAGTVGAVLGTGPGRGIGLMYVLFAAAMLAMVAGAVRTPVLARFDEQVPDAPPDDLVGLQELARQRSRP